MNAVDLVLKAKAQESKPPRKRSGSMALARFKPTPLTLPSSQGTPLAPSAPTLSAAPLGPPAPARAPAQIRERDLFTESEAAHPPPIDMLPQIPVRMPEHLPVQMPASLPQRQAQRPTDQGERSSSPWQTFGRKAWRKGQRPAAGSFDSRTEPSFEPGFEPGSDSRGGRAFEGRADAGFGGGEQSTTARGGERAFERRSAPQLNRIPELVGGEPVADEATAGQAPKRSRRQKRSMQLPVKIGSTPGATNDLLPARLPNFDLPLVWVVAMLLAWGLIMVYSASIALPQARHFAKYDQTHFVLLHGTWIALSIVAATVAVQVRMQWWERAAPWLFVGTILLLIAVLIPHVGMEINYSRRWLGMGPVRFQPSELIKLTILIYAADYMHRRMDVKERFFKAVIPMAGAVAMVGMLLLGQPDMGGFFVIAVIAMGILFLGGVNARMSLIIAVILITAFVLMVAASKWRRERIFAYLNPWSDTNALGKGYQLSHALIAIGRGQVWGVGLGGSIEKLNWLPEAHTDFLLAVIGEEFGLVGVLMVILAFLWLTRRIMVIGRRAIALDRVFSGLTAQGIALWLGFQAFINIGVNLGALPTKGLTLPFMSYGGSAIIINMIAIAIVLRVDLENRILMRGGRA